MSSESNNNDVDAGVVATGCATGCGSGCLLLIVLSMVVASMGVAQATRSGLPNLLGFVGGLLCDVIVGYVVGRAARAKSKPVNLHVFIVGGLTMIVGLLNFVNPQLIKASQQNSLAILLGMISFILTIPLMLWGAELGKEESVNL